MPEKRGIAFEKLTAKIVQVYHPNCKVEQGGWIKGPDGRRDKDVTIEGVFNQKNRKILIECKDFDPKKKRLVGIGIVDALESKIRDLGFTDGAICSNSGFTRTALNKLKRNGMGAISLLNSGNQLVKYEVHEIAYYQVLTVKNFHITPRWNMSTPTHTDNNNEFTIEDILWNDEKLYKWVQFQLTQNLGFARAFEEDTLEEAFIFKKPITIKIKGKKHLLNSVVGYLNIESQWYKTPIQLDADMAIFDYISNKYVFPPGQFKTHISGLNILEKEGEKVCYSEVKDNWGFNNLVGRSFVFLYEGLNFKTEHCKSLTQHVSERKLIKPRELPTLDKW